MAETSTPKPSDGQLMSRIAAGDPMGLRLLMDRYDRLVRFTIYRTSRQRCGRDPIWMDSVASEVWTDMCRALRARKSPQIENMKSFFIQMTRRRCIDALRRPANAPLGGQGPTEPNEMQPIAETEDTLEVLADLEELSALRQCILALGEQDRGLCGEIAAIMAGRWREAAARLAMPESTLRSRWARVLDRLRVCLEKKGKTHRASSRPARPLG